METNKLYQEFAITSVCRADLVGELCTEQEALKIDDADMAHLASKMADAYCESGFWIDLEILAEDIIKAVKTI